MTADVGVSATGRGALVRPDADASENASLRTSVDLATAEAQGFAWLWDGTAWGDALSVSVASTKVDADTALTAADATSLTGTVSGFGGTWTCSPVTATASGDDEYGCCRRFQPLPDAETTSDYRLAAGMVVEPISWVEGRTRRLMSEHRLS